MKDLKGLNEEFRTLYGVDGQVTEDFPAHIGFDFKASYLLRRHDLGAYYSHNATGSRVSYEDYSGRYSVNQVLSSDQFGFSYGYELIEESKWHTVLSFRIGWVTTSHEIQRYIQLGTSSDSEDYQFESKSQMVSPGILVGRDLLPWMGVSLDLRYMAEIPQNLHVKGDADVFLVNDQGTPLGAQWSGLRMMGLVYFRLKK